MSAAAPRVIVTIGGKKIESGDVLSHSVERDMYQPDMASIVMSNQNDAYGESFHSGDEVDISVGDELKSIYKGEVVGSEPQYKGGDTTKLLVRSMNKLHRLLRKKQSLTFAEKNDEQILQQVLSVHGLTLEFKGPKIQYKHVYQHNLSDLEFLRLRASRIGCHVWCIGKVVHVKFPDFSKTSSTPLSVDHDGILRGFSPRLSSATVTKKVTVKGWDPEKKELITGTATQGSSSLGAKSAPDACGEHTADESFTVDEPIWSKQEADAIAKAKLMEGNLQYITGEAECRGGAEFDLGEVVNLTANARGDKFNGKYYIMGVSHRHTLPKQSAGGYQTTLKLARDAQGS